MIGFCWLGIMQLSSCVSLALAGRAAGLGACFVRWACSCKCASTSAPQIVVEFLDLADSDTYYAYVCMEYGLRPGLLWLNKGGLPNTYLILTYCNVRGTSRVTMYVCAYHPIHTYTYARLVCAYLGRYRCAVTQVASRSPSARQLGGGWVAGGQTKIWGTRNAQVPDVGLPKVPNTGISYYSTQLTGSPGGGTSSPYIKWASQRPESKSYCLLVG